MDANDLKGVRLPGSVAAAVRGTPKPRKLWYVATYGNGGLEVQFYDDALAYGRAVNAARIAWDQGGEGDWRVDSYTNGEASV